MNTRPTGFCHRCNKDLTDVMRLIGRQAAEAHQMAHFVEDMHEIQTNLRTAVEMLNLAVPLFQEKGAHQVGNHNSGAWVAQYTENLLATIAAEEEARAVVCFPKLVEGS